MSDSHFNFLFRALNSSFPAPYRAVTAASNHHILELAAGPRLPWLLRISLSHRINITSSSGSNVSQSDCITSDQSMETIIISYWPGLLSSKYKCTWVLYFLTNAGLGNLGKIRGFHEL